ncbi:MAG: hypothetical protein CMI14_09605 [Oleispira sp.]|jgi:hypothetical protein|nr:hypothetical protein [Oleispira sp.]|tara:strand:+ start:3998 stop:4834 length:837 start_codon:yes stop_codon:yes gene_type:complete
MKKIICISLIVSANSFALLPMQDDDLSTVSGQSGITVDITTDSDIKVGEVRYEDKDNGAAEKDGGGSFSLRDVVIKDSEFSFDIDVSDSGELVMSLNRFGVMDISIDALQFNYDDTLSEINLFSTSSETQLQNQYSRLGSLAVNDFTLATGSEITFKFTSDGEFAFTAGLLTGSFFQFTYIDDGEFTYDTANDGDTTLNDNEGENYISARVEFEDFKLNDVKLKGEGVGEDSYVAMSLGGTQGAVVFRDININGKIIGSAGFENISVDPVSYLHIKGH